MTFNEERMKILELIEQEAITAEEGLHLLNVFTKTQLDTDRLPHETGAREDTLTEKTESHIDPSYLSQDINKWKRWWIVPFGIGIAISLIGGLLAFGVWNAHGFGFWFVLTWIPLLSGLVLMGFAWVSRKSPWLHVRVYQKSKPSRIAISLPLPLRFSSWFLRTFGHFIPGIDTISFNEIIMYLNDTSKNQTPLFVNVQDEEDGEHVQVYIG